MDSPKVKRALISVSNKMGVVDFAKGLISAAWRSTAPGGLGGILNRLGSK